MKKNKRRLGFSIIDFAIFALVAACVVSTLFREQIQSFVGAENGVSLEYTFVIKNVTEAANNRPQSGEQLTDRESGVIIGSITRIDEKKVSYENADEGIIEVYTLTCKAGCAAREEASGYFVNGTAIKPGAEISAETPSATFQITVIAVKNVSEE